VPDGIVDRFCLLGPPAAHVERLLELKSLGVDQFAIYLQHDSKESTLQSYAEPSCPPWPDQVIARIVTRRLRKVAMFLVALVLICLLWEGYKWFGTAVDGKVFGWKLPARTDERHAPRLGRAAALRSTRSAAGPTRRSGSWCWRERGSRSAWRWWG
jgi:hypothetical protein